MFKSRYLIRLLFVSATISLPTYLLGSIWSLPRGWIQYFNLVWTLASTPLPSLSLSLPLQAAAKAALSSSLFLLSIGSTLLIHMVPIYSWKWGNTHPIFIHDFSQKITTNPPLICSHDFSPLLTPFFKPCLHPIKARIVWVCLHTQHYTILSDEFKGTWKSNSGIRFCILQCVKGLWASQNKLTLHYKLGYIIFHTNQTLSRYISQNLFFSASIRTESLYTLYICNTS